MQASEKTARPWEMLRLASLLIAGLFAQSGFSQATAIPPPACASGRYAQVTVSPAATSIYVGKVRLAMPPFTWRGAEYVSTYTAKVIPFFFFSEEGQISIEFSDAQLRQLESGESVNLSGHASNSRGAARRIDGRAVPAAPGGDHGKIKVRVWVSKNIDLVFNTTYRFTGKD
jgi:hypothetical protein